MTRIQIVSDLHIEYNNDDDINPLKLIKPSADIIILAGDIGSLYKFQQLKTFLQKLSSHFKLMFYTPGNQERYYIANYKPLKIDELDKKLTILEQSISNLYILERSSVLLGNLCIAGCTLWSYPKCNIPSYIVRIHEMNTEDYINKHNTDVNYIKNIINHCAIKKHKLLIVTHHPPTFKVLKNNKKDKFVSLYATDLEYLITKNDIVSAWICGHIHKHFDIKINNTRVIGNPKGKKKDGKTNYNKSFVIDL